MTTKAETAAAVRAARERSDSGEVRLWIVVNDLQSCLQQLTALDAVLAEQLRLLVNDLNVKAMMEEEGHAPGPDLVINLADVRCIADALSA